MSKIVQFGNCSFLATAIAGVELRINSYDVVITLAFAPSIDGMPERRFHYKDEKGAEEGYVEMVALWKAALGDDSKPD